LCAGRLSDFTEQGLTNVVWALARLRLGPAELGIDYYRDWAKVALSRFPQVYSFVRFLFFFS
jgi:hypothetical protein